MFHTNKSRDAWKGLRTTTGLRSKLTLTETEDDDAFEEEFYSRFETSYEQEDLYHIMETLSNMCDSVTCPKVTEDQVRHMFRSLNSRKSEGPGRIAAKVLNECYQQPSPIFTRYFYLSFALHKVPPLWKTSELAPVPKLPIYTCNQK